MRSSWFVNHSGNPQRQVSLRKVICFRSLMTSPDWLLVHIRKTNLLGGNRFWMSFLLLLRLYVQGTHRCVPEGSLHQQCWCSEVASDRFFPYICRNAEFSKECRKKIYVYLFLSRALTYGLCQANSDASGNSSSAFYEELSNCLCFTFFTFSVNDTTYPLGFKPINVSKSR